MGRGGVYSRALGRLSWDAGAPASPPPAFERPRGSRAGGGGRWRSEPARPGPSGAARLPRLGAGKNVPSHGAILGGAEVSSGLGLGAPLLPPPPAPRTLRALAAAPSPRLAVQGCSLAK